MKKLTLSLLLGSLAIFPVPQTLGMGRLGAMAAAAAAIAMQSKKAETVFWGTGSVVIGSVNGNVGGDFYVVNGTKTVELGHTVGSGNRTTKTTAISGSPTKVDVSFGNVTIKQGTPPELVVHADDNIHKYLKQEITAKSIKLGLQENSYFTTENPIEYTLTLENMPNDLRASGNSSITTPAIKVEQMKLILSGQSKIYIPTLQAKKLAVEASGQSSVRIPAVKTDTVSVDVSGQSDITLAGSTNKQSVGCSGQSSYKAAELKSGRTDIDVSGQSSGKVLATEQVTGSVSGMSNLAIGGRPKPNVDVDVSGMSRWFFV